MASVISICNAALSNIGAANISSLTEASAEARACNQFYEQTRDTFLQSFDWKIAGRTAALAEVVNDKPGRWAHAYRLPSDCLKVRTIRPNYDPEGIGYASIKSGLDEIKATAAYEIEGQTLYTNLGTALLFYTYRLTDPSKLSPLMVEALAWNLAVPLAMPITKDAKVRADAKNIAQVETAAASAADVGQAVGSSSFTSSFIEARD